MHGHTFGLISECRLENCERSLMSDLTWQLTLDHKGNSVNSSRLEQCWLIRMKELCLCKEMHKWQQHGPFWSNMRKTRVTCRKPTWDVVCVRVLQVNSWIHSCPDCKVKHFIIFTIGRFYLQKHIASKHGRESREVNNCPGGNLLNVQANTIQDYWFLNM